MNVKATPATRLKQLIERKRLQKKDFAELCGCTPQTISKILNNKSVISTNLLERFSDVLGVSGEYIMCQTDDPNPNTNFLYVMDQTKQRQIVSHVIDLFGSLGYNFTEKIQIGNKIYIQTEDNNFYLESKSHIKISEDELCANILTTSEPVYHIYAVPKKVALYTNNTEILQPEHTGDYKHISADEFYNFINNFIISTKTHLDPCEVHNTIINSSNKIDEAIKTKELQNEQSTESEDFINE